MGNDFNYENARPWFANLDKLIAHVNARVNATSIHYNLIININLFNVKFNFMYI